MLRGFEKSNIQIVVKEVALDLALIIRSGKLDPIVFLHGFGSTKEDYADIVLHEHFDDHAFIAYDAPGCGETDCSDTKAVNIPFLVETALTVLDELKIQNFHLVGHSMGGLTALILAHRCPERILSFVDIEGNVAAEDCFLSRQIVEFEYSDPQQFFEAFIERTMQEPAFSSALYAASLRYKVRAEAVKGIFESMVELSDKGSLMDKFLDLPCPKMFMYGEQNAALSYLDYLQENGVHLAEIPNCGHFPMYSNPVLMWDAIARLQQ